MVYTDNCPVLNDIEWKDNCQFPVIRDGETPSGWKKQIWNQLVDYRNNNKLADYHKRYIIARKMESTEGFNYSMAVKVNIAICYSCYQFVYVDKRVGYELYHNYKMEEHWRTNCTGNRHCDISFREYMELKQKPRILMAVDDPLSV
ncbi:9810_t:CDS:1 [Entrophospora sp. SA101]|nr:9810_t:CDS:1 [Entrophospora sp. SA101]